MIREDAEDEQQDRPAGSIKLGDEVGSVRGVFQAWLAAVRPSTLTMLPESGSMVAGTKWKLR
jgi:hypothetical protein